MKDDKLLELLQEYKRDPSKLDEAIKALKPDVWIPPKDTLVLCKKEHRRYSTGALSPEGFLLCYRGGRTSQTEIGVEAWKTWEPVPDAKPIVPWQPYTPVRPDCKRVLVMLEDLSIFTGSCDGIEWDNSKRSDRNKITHFCVWE